eukprot:gnl/Hemi2/28553_TR9462_c0_g1_i1.p1 gnl/Hemi2/28553_TR9462_c0_g1~~gnl/Hemi2/28553_TR9462_c0_g1_i1.p1  ORF type:complete len:437 (-),score=153.41 gnl/Hemi2/28553_TR9462_c0_g1_i1:57-1367(-)
MSFSLSMNTDFATREQVEAFVSKHKIRNMLQSLFSELVIQMPENPILYMMDSLKSKMKAADIAPAKPKRVTIIKNGETRFGQICFVSNDKEAFLQKAGQLLRTRARRMFNSRGAEYTDVNMIDGEETIYISDGSDFVDPHTPHSADAEIQAEPEEEEKTTADQSPEPATPLIVEKVTLTLNSQDAAKLHGLSLMTFGSIEAGGLLGLLNRVRTADTPSLTADGLAEILDIVSSMAEDADKEVLTQHIPATMAQFFDQAGAGAYEWAHFASLLVLCKGSYEEKLQALYGVVDAESTGAVAREVLINAVDASLCLGFALGSANFTADIQQNLRALAEDLLSVPNAEGELIAAMDFDTFANLVGATEHLRHMLEANSAPPTAEPSGPASPAPESGEESGVEVSGARTPTSPRPENNSRPSSAERNSSASGGEDSTPADD